jgi:hypothetical protein
MALWTSRIDKPAWKNENPMNNEQEIPRMNLVVMYPGDLQYCSKTRRQRTGNCASLAGWVGLRSCRSLVCTSGKHFVCTLTRQRHTLPLQIRSRDAACRVPWRLCLLNKVGTRQGSRRWDIALTHPWWPKYPRTVSEFCSMSPSALS